VLHLTPVTNDENQTSEKISKIIYHPDGKFVLDVDRDIGAVFYEGREFCSQFRLIIKFWNLP